MKGVKEKYGKKI